MDGRFSITTKANPTTRHISAPLPRSWPGGQSSSSAHKAVSEPDLHPWPGERALSTGQHVAPESLDTIADRDAPLRSNRNRPPEYVSAGGGSCSLRISSLQAAHARTSRLPL